MFVNFVLTPTQKQAILYRLLASGMTFFAIFSYRFYYLLFFSVFRIALILSTAIFGPEYLHLFDILFLAKYVFLYH